MCLFSFATVNASGGSQDLNSLYENKLKTSYEELKPYKEAAKNRKTTYIISAIVWLLVFGLFAKNFGLSGVIVSLIMGGAGYYYLSSMQTSPISDFENVYKSKLISPIANNSSGFLYDNGNMSKEEFLETKIFATKIKSYHSEDIYAKDGVKFSWVDVTFDTGNNEAEERMEQNIFKGYIVTLDRKNSSHGVVISQLLSDKVAKEDIKMGSFFSDLKPRSHKGKFDIYGNVSEEDFIDAEKLSSERVAVSFMNDKIYIALYSQTYPLEAKIYTDFDLNTAQKYEDSFKYIDKIVDAF
jgi:hypothetical protein